MGLLGRLEKPGRLVGIDLARTLALVGMIATHVIAARDAADEVTLAHQIASGRASALFAVLAGLSMALVSGGRRPLAAGELRRARLGLAARAVLIGALGLALGDLDTGLAVILPAYALLFLLALPFLGLAARPLLVIAAVWVVAAPALSQVVRPLLPERSYENPMFADLASPGRLLADLLFTGYYPAAAWLAYLLVGLALGRLDLRGLRTPLLLATIGSGAAITAFAISRLATSLASVREAIIPTAGPVSEASVLDILADNQFGSTPTGGSWAWLLVVSPHSATPLDLAHTIGTSVAVIGLCLALAHLWPRRIRPLLVLLAGAGAAPLTCYVIHLLMRTPEVPPAEVPGVLGVHLGVVLGVGAVIALSGRRGPLESVVGLPGRLLQARARLTRPDAPTR
ncbi:heparan-alpha-glucosaminide N-acetyltransferase domain-containing protein [Nocardioides sp.]|uniref:heparan-alpha-glucosaminide N-acetyltransferase domain-containing protein n=1 Tax=Nocardioides sp. TaxID=35761 RepID=UPI0035128343